MNIDVTNTNISITPLNKLKGGGCFYNYKDDNVYMVTNEPGLDIACACLHDGKIEYYNRNIEVVELEQIQEAIFSI